MKSLILGAAFGAIAFGAAGSALATHHHVAAKHHASARHHGSSARHDDRHHDHAAKPSSPKGATSVPAGGIKLFCGPGKSPLMVRKMTQGNGTTVTVICR